jgi:hypothetical protein
VKTWKLVKREKVPGDLPNREEEKFTYSAGPGETVAIRWNTKVAFGTVIQHSAGMPRKVVMAVAKKWGDAQFASVNDGRPEALNELVTK